MRVCFVPSYYLPEEPTLIMMKVGKNIVYYFNPKSCPTYTLNEVAKGATDLGFEVISKEELDY